MLVRLHSQLLTQSHDLLLIVDRVLPHLLLHVFELLECQVLSRVQVLRLLVNLTLVRALDTLKLLQHHADFLLQLSYLLGLYLIVALECEALLLFSLVLQS